MHQQILANVARDKPPQTSAQAFQAYVDAFLQYNDPAEFTIVFQGAAQAQLASLPGEECDAVVLVGYRSLGVFRRWVASDFYTSQVAPSRRAALADWHLLLLTRPGTYGMAIAQADCLQQALIRPCRRVGRTGPRRRRPPGLRATLPR
jgi:hypothetical protein